MNLLRLPSPDIIKSNKILQRTNNFFQLLYGYRDKNSIFKTHLISTTEWDIYGNRLNGDLMRSIN